MRLVPWLAVAISTAAFACQGDAPPTPRAGTPVSTHEPTPLATSGPKEGPPVAVTARPPVPPDTRVAPGPLSGPRPPATGVERVDTLARAVYERDVETIDALIEYGRLACVAEAGYTLLTCPPGVSPGTLTEFVVTLGCVEGSLVSDADARLAVLWFVNEDLQWSDAYRVVTPDGFGLRAGFVIVFSWRIPWERHENTLIEPRPAYGVGVVHMRDEGPWAFQLCEQRTAGDYRADPALERVAHLP